MEQQIIFRECLSALLVMLPVVQIWHSIQQLEMNHHGVEGQIHEVLFSVCSIYIIFLSQMKLNLYITGICCMNDDDDTNTSIGLCLL